MNIKKLFISVTLVLFMGIWGCSLEEPDVTITTLSSGNADFSRYVAIGNSLTAGYQSGALTAIHQQYSYPNFIAQQAGVETFEQPLLEFPGIGAYTLAGGGILQLKFLDNPATSTPLDPLIEPAAYTDYPDFNRLMPYISTDVMNYPLPYNNLGVPGALLVDVLNASSSGTSASGNNPFFDVILRGVGTSFQQAKALQPTFLTCWIGSNDVLGYATNGGVFPPTPTDNAAFGFLYGQLLDSLQTTGADIVVANIPDVTTIPFFTTVPYAIDPGIGTAVALIIETNVGVRQATQNDLILLLAQSVIGDVSGDYGPPNVPVGFDASAPLPNGLVLDADEVTIAKNAVTDFNNTISTLASARGIPVVDMNGFITDAYQNGLLIGGQEFNADFITGGLFSLDGVHPSDIGHAVVANQFIATINEEFDSTIPFVNVIDLMGEISPSVNLEKATYSKDALQNMVKMLSGK